MVSLITMSANHDEAVLTNADRFDITREALGNWQLGHLAAGALLHGRKPRPSELTEALAELSARWLLRLTGSLSPRRWNYRSSAINRCRLRGISGARAQRPR
jgi:cytochrome P450